MNELAAKCKWVFVILFFSGCAHQFELSQQSMSRVETFTVKKSFWLKQSLYAGPFYDDDRFYLVHPSSFDELTYLKMPDGETILPPPSEKIIPAGTRVTIQNIEWPNTSNFFNRPLFTPRDLPWMKMKIALDRGHVSMLRDETFIFLLPIQKENESHFERWFQSIFSEQDSNPWLLGLAEPVKNAVLRKEAIVGMPHQALLAALGEPNMLTKEVVSENGKSLTKEIATYAKQIVVLTDGVVSKVQVLTPSTPAQFHRVRGNENG